VSATASHVIDEYVAGLSRRLTGPRRAKVDLITEARDGLTDAADAYAEAGFSVEEAAAQAVSDFGSYRQVVPGYQTELAVAQGRFTAVLIVIAMPVGMGLSRFMLSANPPTSGYLLVAHTYQVLQLTALIMAALTLLGYGRGSRYLPAEQVPAAVLLTRLMGIGVLFFVTAQVGTGIIVYAWSPHTWPPTLAGAALLPLCLLAIGRSALHCLRATGLRAADLRSGGGLLVPRLR
jgi:hypothetical protein